MKLKIIFTCWEQVLINWIVAVGLICAVIYLLAWVFM